MKLDGPFDEIFDIFRAAGTFPPKQEPEDE